jgi:CheY-like chemotaxis protein
LENDANLSKNSPTVLHDSAREIFRQHLRLADKLIIDGKFSEAKIEVAHAKKLEPRNPFIIAFEERIALFENKIVSGHKKIASSPPTNQPQAHVETHPQKEISKDDQMTREMLEQKLRQQIEGEYKIRFTQELRKAEEHTARILEEERGKLEHQRQTLKTKFDHQIEEARKQSDQQYQQKLDEEVAKTEDRLGQQHEGELAFIENEMKTELTKQYESDLKNLQDRMKREQEELLVKEKQTFQEREQTLKEQFNQKLVDTLRNTETVCREQNQQQLEVEREQVKRSLASEFEAKLVEDKNSLLQEYQKVKTKLEENYLVKKNELYPEVEKRVQEKLDTLSKTEAEKYEQKRAALRKELEADFQSKYENQLAEERNRIQTETKEMLGAEKKRLEEEIAKAEKQLEKKHKAELVKIEDRIRSELTKQYETDLLNLQNRLKQEQDEILEKERQASQQREQLLKEKSNTKLLESLRKTEALFQEQGRQQLQIEREKVEQQFRAEFQVKLKSGQETLKHQFEEAKGKLEKAYLMKEAELNAVIEGRVQEQIKILREIEEEKFEQRRITLRKELETEFHQRYEKQIAEERDRLQREATATIEAEKKRSESEYEQLIQKQNEQLQKVRTDLRNEMEATFLARLERVAQEYDHKMELLGAKIPEAKEERLNLYKQKMYTCYRQGQPSVDEARDLMKLKELLELTFDEHLDVESDVRLELYSRYVQKKIHYGELEAHNTDELDRLKQQFNITAEEATRLEPYILSCFQRLITKGRLLIVDDDLLLLKSLEDMLYSCDYQVITAPDINSALEKLDTEAFDLILSDIKFGVGELDGFKFFKAVQERENLRNIPFVFMSALQDGVIIRSGVQLGIDDYITKPMDPDLLIATIEGKLKRFRNIQRN